MSVNHSARSGGIIGISSRFSLINMKVFCVFSLESPHRGDFNKYTQYTIFNIKRKIDLNNLKSAAMGFFPGTQARVRNSHGKRAIGVRAIEVLLYIQTRKKPQRSSSWVLKIKEIEHGLWACTER